MIIDKNNSEKKILIDLIQPENKIILEIGCGDGTIAKHISPLCQKYIGIDVNKNIIAKAKKNNKNKNLIFNQTSSKNIKFPNNSFDTVLMHLCFHEIAVQKQGLVLQEINRVLKKGGQLLIIDPTEPPDQVQQIFNVAYKNFQYFDHSIVVKHSIWSIKESIFNKLFKINKLSTYKVDWKFNDFKELIDFIISCSKEIIWDKNNKQFLEKELIKIAKPKNKTNAIIIYDSLTINNLINLK